MIGLDDYDSEQQSTSELPEKPLKEWRRKYEAGTLVAPNLMQYFSAASPFFFTIDQTAEYADLGKRNASISHCKLFEKETMTRTTVFLQQEKSDRNRYKNNTANNTSKCSKTIK